MYSNKLEQDAFSKRSSLCLNAVSAATQKQSPSLWRQVQKQVVKSTFWTFLLSAEHFQGDHEHHDHYVHQVNHVHCFKLWGDEAEILLNWNHSICPMNRAIKTWVGLIVVIFLQHGTACDFYFHKFQGHSYDLKFRNVEKGLPPLGFKVIIKS